MMNLDEYPVVTENSESYLNQRQLLDHRTEREECLRWLLSSVPRFILRVITKDDFAVYTRVTPPRQRSLLVA